MDHFWAKGCVGALAMGLMAGLLGCSSQPSAAAPSDAPQETAQLDRFDSCAVKQHTEVWCWAACAEMVHRFYNKPMTQEEIVAQIMQRSANDPDAVAAADRQEVLGALDTDLFDYLKKCDDKKPTWEQKLLTTGHMRWGVSMKDLMNMPQEPHLGYDPNRLGRSLSEDRAPVILALKPMSDGDPGHIVVIHQIVFQETDSSPNQTWNALQGFGSQALHQMLNQNTPQPRPQSQTPAVTRSYTVVQATYMDPDTGQDTVITGQELAVRADFIATREDADKYLKYLKAFQQWAEDIANGNNAGDQQGPLSSGYSLAPKK